MNNTDNNTKLQLCISSVTVLERLIGGDTEVEANLRNAIAQNFAKRHIKSLMNHEAIQKSVDEIKREVRGVVQEILVGDRYEHGVENVLRDTIQKHLSEGIERAVREQLGEAVRAEVEKQVVEAMPSINARVEMNLHKHALWEMKAQIRERVRLFLDEDANSAKAAIVATKGE